MAAAVVGTTIAVGVFILILLFLASHLYKRKLIQLTRPSRFETAKNPRGQLHQECRVRNSSLQVDFTNKKEEEPQGGITGGHPSQIRKAAASLARIFHAPARTTETSSTSLPEASERSTTSPWRSSIQAERLPTNLTVPEPAELRLERHDSPPALWRPPVALPRLKTQPTELCGSDEGMRNTGTTVPVPAPAPVPKSFQTKPVDSWSMSTLGRELLRDTMCEPDPSQFEPSPETPMVHSAKRMPSPLQAFYLTTPVIPRHYRSTIAGFEAQMPSPPSPGVRGDWTIEEGKEWSGGRSGRNMS